MSEIQDEYMNMPSLISFISQHADPHAIKKKDFFALFGSAIKKIEDGDSLFDSTDNDVLLLQECVKKSWITLLASTQLAESKVKDTPSCASTGIYEGKVSLIAMMRSTVIPDVASAVK